MSTRAESSSSVKVFFPKFDRESLIAKIRARLPQLGGKMDLAFIGLFGSYAMGRHTAASDIDLLVVYRGESNRDAYGLVVKALGIPRLEPLIYSQEEFKKVLRSSPSLRRVIREETVPIMGEQPLCPIGSS